MRMETARWKEPQPKFIFIVTVFGVDSTVKLSVDLEPGLWRYEIKSPET